MPTAGVRMETLTLLDGSEPFDVSVHAASAGKSAVLFAVGAGGDPLRYGTLLAALANAGCTVIAPHFQRLAATTPSEGELMRRARRLRLAMNSLTEASATVTAIGHSIGGATLLALAGGQLWLGPGQHIEIPTAPRIRKLALLATPTGFFRAPGALDTVHAPLLAWAGSEDHITPPAQSEWLVQTLQMQALQTARTAQTTKLHITRGAGHFSCMDQPPPHTVEPLQDKHAFLEGLAGTLCRFVVGTD